MADQSCVFIGLLRPPMLMGSAHKVREGQAVAKALRAHTGSVNFVLRALATRLMLHMQNHCGRNVEKRPVIHTHRSKTGTAKGL